MSRSLIWGLGGTSMAAAASVAGYIVLNAPEEPVRDAPPEVQPVAVVDDADVTAVTPAADRVVAQDAPTEDPVAVVDEDAAQPPMPTFDVVRVARDGNALVAGQASPGAQIELRVDDQIVAQSVADASGQFVAMFDLGHSEAAQLMTLSMQRDGEAAVVSPDQVILTPRPAEVVVASADPEPVVEAQSEAVQAEAGPVELAVLEDTAVPEVEIAAPDLADVVADIAPATETVPTAEVATDATSETTAEAVLQVAAEPVLEAMPDSDVEATAQVVDDLTPMGQAVTDVAQDEVTELAEVPQPEPDVSVVASGHSEAPQDEVQPVDLQVARADTDVQTEIAQAPQSEAEATPEPIELAQDEPVAEMPTALLVRGSGEVELLDRAPQVMDNVVIDTISYTAVGDVQIAGRASGEAPQANLRIYLNNMPIAVAQSTGGDWASDLPDVDPGVYTLRVDQLSDTGGVVSRFETPFQREDPERVVAAQARAAGQANVETAPTTEAPPVSQSDEVVAEAVAQATEPAATPSAVAEADAAASEQTEQSAPATGLAEVTQSQPAPSAQDTEIAEVVTAPAETAPAETAPVETASVEAAPVEAISAEAEVPSEPAPAETAAVEVAQVAPEPVMPEPVTPAPATPEPPISLITVQPGATLWAISRDRYGAGELYVQIYRANRSQIRNPDLIYPGQIFSLPD